ncbi:MAG: sigma-70 family RNA polymerase sigma factor [Planctomycetaceae bacterium]
MTTENSSQITRSSLIRRASDRDSGAWCEIVDLYGPLIAHWCRRCGLETHSTADCVQEVFSSVAISISAFKPTRLSGSFRAWLWTITRHKVLDWVRKQNGFPQPAGGSTAIARLREIVDTSTIPDDEPTGDEQLQGLIQRALRQVEAEFEPGTWRGFWRSVVDGIPTEIVAAELNVTAATIRQARSRVLRKLRQQLGDL